jgi:hypothetical protein
MEKWKKVRISDEDYGYLSHVKFNNLLLKEVAKVRPDLVLDLRSVNISTLKVIKEMVIITCFWLLEDGFNPNYSYWKDVGGSMISFTFPPGRFIVHIQKREGGSGGSSKEESLKSIHLSTGWKSQLLKVMGERI